MYIDKTLKLNFYIPEILQEYIDLAEKSFADGNDIQFDDAMEMVGVIAKECALDGRISYSDMSKIKKKYGGWG